MIWDAQASQDYIVITPQFNIYLIDGGLVNIYFAVVSESGNRFFFKKSTPAL